MNSTRKLLFALALIVGALFGLKFVLQINPLPSSPTIIPPISPSPFITATQSLSPTQTVSNPKFNSIKIGENELSVEIVFTPDEIQLGLSGRNEIGSDGMLFVINPPRQISFWMKDMLIPLDIIWISNEKITGIEKNVPPPLSGTPENKLTNYPSPNPVDYVLELKAGDADFWGIKVLDVVTVL